MKTMAKKANEAIVAMKKVLPDLSATDLTSNGESITVERVQFKP